MSFHQGIQNIVYLRLDLQTDSRIYRGTVATCFCRNDSARSLGYRVRETAVPLYSTSTAPVGRWGIGLSTPFVETILSLQLVCRSSIQDSTDGSLPLVQFERSTCQDSIDIYFVPLSFSYSIRKTQQPAAGHRNTNSLHQFVNNQPADSREVNNLNIR